MTTDSQRNLRTPRGDRGGGERPLSRWTSALHLPARARKKPWASARPTPSPSGADALARPVGRAALMRINAW